MDNDKKEVINAYMELLIKALKSEDLFFGIIVDKSDVNNSKLAFIDKEKYVLNGEIDAVNISITELNKYLL